LIAECAQTLLGVSDVVFAVEDKSERGSDLSRSVRGISALETHTRCLLKLVAERVFTFDSIALNLYIVFVLSANALKRSVFGGSDLFGLDPAHIASGAQERSQVRAPKAWRKRELVVERAQSRGLDRDLEAAAVRNQKPPALGEFARVNNAFITDNKIKIVGEGRELFSFGRVLEFTLPV
jgi:hypothetical protein